MDGMPRRKRLLRFDSKWADRCTYWNLDVIDAEIYKEILKGKIADELEQQVNVV